MLRLFLSLILFMTHGLAVTSSAADRPNVIFLAVDDMNDWIGCLNGTPPMVRPHAITPNLDKLADRGVNFTNAHTAGVFCAPSRAAIFSGQFATTTGCYMTPYYFTNKPEIEGLQMSFQKAGYTTLGAGKLFHHPAGAIDQRGWNEFFLRNASQRENGWPLDSWSAETPFPKPFPASVYNIGKKVTGGLFLEWGAIPNTREEEMADTIRVNWAVEQLKKKHDKPFFLACGIYAPHFPNYCPQKYFDLYKPDNLTLPQYKKDDAEDLPETVRRRMNGRRKLHHERLEELGAIDDAIHGYLACISYADAMMGRVLDALEASPYADNTIVVLWSDHGYHQGQKGQWGKHTLWERTSNVPFIWAGPGVAETAKTDVTVSLIDMYPTLVDMCQLPQPAQKLEGVSLASTLASPAKAEDRDVLLPYSEPGAYAVINRNWRYIHYADETEELYDLQKDPDEWNNLANKKEHAKQLASLKARGPKSFAEPEKKWNARRDLVVDGGTFRWEEGAGNATTSSGYVPPVTVRDPSKKKAPVSRKDAYAVLSPAAAAKKPKKAKPEGIAGRVVTGYQGWFRAEGDGSGMRFHHYDKNGKFEPGHCSIDLWPDLSEFPEEERFPTAFKHADGRVAEVFSSVHPGTVNRHFRWMADYGIDGAFVQRFATHGAKPRKDSRGLLWENEKLKLCRDAAIRNDRCWILMYDLSGLNDDDFPRLAEDWKNLRRRMKLGTDPNDTAYLRMNGKPLVAIWGVGFGGDRDYSLEKAEWFIRLLKNNPEWGGMSIMLGTPYFWREQRRDAARHKRLHEVLKLADIISPWSVGRYRGKPDEMEKIVTQQRLDREWGAAHGIKTLPVIFPGFSWKNLKGLDERGIPRRKGAFLWEQFLATAAAGNEAAYIAMFDEVDEATAIFKCTNTPPVGASPFLTYEGLPSDHYLKLAGKGRRLLRGEPVGR